MKKLVCKLLDYAKQFTVITPKDVEIIMHVRKSLLFANVNLSVYTYFTYWEVNLAMITWDFTDGLACFHGIDGPTSDKTRKDIVNVFKDLGLKITIKTNLKIVNFLDVTLNLATGTYQPYNKPNGQPLYINIKSNHPPNIIKAIPESISRRSSSISSNKEIFDAAAPLYNNALAASGYDEEIQYKPHSAKNRRRIRKIVWYYPPYSINVKTNIIM